MKIDFDLNNSGAAWDNYSSKYRLINLLRKLDIRCNPYYGGEYVVPTSGLYSVTYGAGRSDEFTTIRSLKTGDRLHASVPVNITKIAK